MKNVNNLFLEQYKRADNLCKDIYNSDTGITNYINIMKDAATYNRQSVSDWDETLKKLIALRHIRNKLTHDVGTLEMELCSDADVLWLDSFCDSILNATDPLARYYRAQTVKKASPKGRKTNKKRTARIIFATLAFLALCILVFCLLVEFYKTTVLS